MGKSPGFRYVPAVAMNNLDVRERVAMMSRHSMTQGRGRAGMDTLIFELIAEQPCGADVMAVRLIPLQSMVPNMATTQFELKPWACFAEIVHPHQRGNPWLWHG